ncbi:GntR family transcriptional regulator [Roseinatronobacter bogoriensis]|uniref:GntR family transcriptional regulator n=1 Tax=Roseinatronobacter bogoriensis subsp. barguzinensis TaxID=441209 RepID=A0A2K8K9F7_9RHOB|nr:MULTISPECIES: GntR family transcriptional regulator [Rhodobaca]ATX64523.1 GntR family transcriptional regulator [Rhodobaca barguzinensis]MBB4209238.1 DNA-binding GntR family transcriptional regulator [Rhodobaca bogoriensis DSM 18756]TDW36236.1 DNA-binding GntR family transcriptional regulator [Rhodobaca barguzinensis]TDY67636.1 GntR family transcriptional regulator [Rhodobaca bogoriensis DSM 18756]
MDNHPTNSSNRSISLPEIAVQRITEFVRNKTLLGGESIVEQKLAMQLGISRTPLREALQRLEGVGMLEKDAGRSYRVRRVYMEEYLQSLKVRALLEPQAAADAIGRIPAQELADVRSALDALQPGITSDRKAHWDFDDQMHRLYTRNCGNLVLYSIIERLRVTTRLFEIADLGARFEADMVEHRTILGALEAGVPADARKAVRAHLRSLMDFSLHQLR